MARLQGFAVGLTLFMVGSVAAAQPAGRDHRGGGGPKFEYAVANVTSIVSDPATGMRVIVGDDNGPFLVVESVRDRNRVEQQVELESVVLRGKSIDVAQLTDLRLLEVSNFMVKFDVTQRRRAVYCEAQVSATQGKRARWTVSAGCEYYNGNQRPQIVQPNGDPNQPPPGPGQPPPGGPQPYNPPPPPSGPGSANGATMQELQAITDACKESFAFDSSQKACVDSGVAMLQGAWRRSVPNVIRACKAGFDFESDRQACMASVATSSREPTEVIGFCTRNKTFASDRRACVSKWAAPQTAGTTASMAEIQQAMDACRDAYSFDNAQDQCLTDALAMMQTRWRTSTVGVIRACKAAFDFDSDRQACLPILVKSSRDPVELVNYCAKNESFATGRKACIQKYAQ